MTASAVVTAPEALGISGVLEAVIALQATPICRPQFEGVAVDAATDRGVTLGGMLAHDAPSSGVSVPGAVTRVPLRA